MADEKMSTKGDDSAMQKFENLATRLFSIAKDDVAKAEEIAEEAVDELLGEKPVEKPTES